MNEYNLNNNANKKFFCSELSSICAILSFLTNFSHYNDGSLKCYYLHILLIQDDPEVKCTIPLPLSLATPLGVSPIFIDTSQSDSDAANMQENTNILGVKSPATKDDDSDATAPWDGEENEERMKDVED